jgi:hypothetical protein
MPMARLSNCGLKERRASSYCLSNRRLCGPKAI